MRKMLLASLLGMGLCLFIVACKNTSTQNSSLSFSSEESNSCGEVSSFEENSSSEEESFCTISFVQDGQADIVKTVKIGETLTDIPTPQAKEGYTVAWDIKNFENLTEDIVVKAEEKAKTYTVILDANGGEVSPKTITVTYDGTYDLSTPTRAEFKFESWTYNGNDVSTSGVWKLAVEEQTVVLIAKWDRGNWSGNY